jgi:hypothetical protein
MQTDGRTNMKLIVDFRSFANASKMKKRKFSLLLAPSYTMILRGLNILLYELHLIPVYSYYRFIPTVFHTVCPSDVPTISSESTEFSSNKPVVEEVVTEEPQSELVGVSSCETSWSISNTYTYHSCRATKQGL